MSHCYDHILEDLKMLLNDKNDVIKDLQRRNCDLIDQNKKLKLQIGDLSKENVTLMHELKQVLDQTSTR